MTWPSGKWPYLFLTVVLMILTRMFRPDVADWMLTWIATIVRYVVDIIPTIGG